MSRFFVFFMVLMSPFLYAEIRECSSIQEILCEIRPNTLFLFDIDNTILRPCQTIGSDEWVDYYWKKKEKEGLSGEELRRSVIELWIAIQVLSKTELIEKSSPEVIESLQNRGFSVMALSSRTESIARTTRLQLRSVGVDMSRSNPSKDSFFLKENLRVWYEGGILFTGGQNKGKALVSFLHHIGMHPEYIVFVDDKTHCLEAVEKETKGEVRFIGLRYNRADPIVKALSPSVAETELEQLLNSLQPGL